MNSHYPLPTIEQVAACLSKTKVLTVLDEKLGSGKSNWMNSQVTLTTFNAPFGGYHWLRMPFGTSSVPEYGSRE